MYDSIEDLPIVRFHKYNKMLLIDAGIGSDIADFDAHLQKARVYLANSKPELASLELDNLRQNVYMIQTGVNPRHLAFCVLVKSINGEPQDDITDEGLKKVLDRFAEYPVSELTAQNEAVKKKIDDELLLFVPQMFDDASVKEYYGELLNRTALVLKSIIEGETPELNEEIENITDTLIMYTNPSVFTGSEGVEVVHEKSFVELCLMLTQRNNDSAKKYTVMEFYVAFDKMKRDVKKENASMKRNKAF